MHAKDISASLYRIPSRNVQQNATHVFREYEYITTRIVFDNGIEGVGWTYTQGSGGTAILHLINDYLAPAVIRDEITSPKMLRKKVWDYTYAFGLEGLGRLAYAALDISFYDALSRERGLPLFRFLGGGEEASIRTYRSAIDLNMTTEELCRDIDNYRKEGYGSFKVKVGREDFREDLKRLEAVRSVIGPDALLMVDANRKWTLKEALSHGKELQKMGVYWLEEPIESDLLDGYAFLSDRLDLMIAGGESLYNRYEMEEFLKKKCADVSQIDVIRAGGVTEWMRLAGLAASMNIQVAPHFCEEIAIHTLCASDSALFLEHLPGSNLRDSGLLKKQFSISRGIAFPPGDPGHGVLFDWEKMEKFRVR
ncbi:MAG: mandelate racemase/muconate lactonizing enzyme family protein [Methanomassiliicoccales archaeon]|nr:mandelate racemase/muconate lactonizing enzyme family protein [Methanomassiliicoccales archaeon]